MLSLFADQEREAKLDSLGDPLALLEQACRLPSHGRGDRPLGSSPESRQRW